MIQWDAPEKRKNALWVHAVKVIASVKMDRKKTKKIGVIIRECAVLLPPTSET